MAPTKPLEDLMADLTATGPALFYTTTQHHDGTQTVQRVDLAPPDDPRERAICRALLRHALVLLDATEPTRPTPVSAQAGRSE